MATVNVPSNRINQVIFSKIPLAALLGGVIAVVANVAFFLIIGAAGLTPRVPSDGMSGPLVPVPIGAVIGASLAPALGAGILLALLARFTRRPILIFQIIAGILLVISLPVFLPNSLGERALLSVMHVIAASAITWALSTRTR